MKPITKILDGSILVVALSTIAATAVFVGVAVSMTTHTIRISDRSQDMAILKAAAEGSLEHGYAIFKGKLAQSNRALTGAELNFAAGQADPAQSFPNLIPLVPDVTQPNQTEDLKVTVCDQYGAPQLPAAAPISAKIDLAGYPGWRGRGYTYMASVKMQSTNSLINNPNVAAQANVEKLSYGVKRYFYYVEAPLFQTMYFYEHDMDLYASGKITIAGLMHSNGSMFLGQGGNAVDILNPVSLVGGFNSKYFNTTSGYLPAGSTLPAPDNTVPNGPTFPYKNDTGNSTYPTSETMPNFPTSGFLSQVKQVSRLEPFGQDPSLVLDAPPTPTATNTAPSGQLLVPDGDSDGNPNNDSMHELIERPVSGFTDPQEISSRRLVNKAAIVISINGAVKTVTSQNGATLTGAQSTAIQTAITNSLIYDPREQKNVRVSNLDIGSALTALNGVTNFNGLIYMEDVTPTTVGTPLNAVRLKNGGVLPTNGLTVASPSGVYIQGDYNTGATSTATAATVPSNVGNSLNNQSPTLGAYIRKPAAVIGDAVMFLSNGWVDAALVAGVPPVPTDFSTRTASSTTYNTAVLAGCITGGYIPAGGGAQYGYSGGINNYPRFLENWSSKYATYFGSMVELFSSTNFIGKWALGIVYQPPIRCYNYDSNFDATVPPGSVDAVSVNRGTWARY